MTTTSPDGLRARLARVPVPGFTDPVHDAQQTFRAVLDALARPARPIQLPVVVGGVASLTPAAAAVLLTLCDDATPLWLDDVVRNQDHLEAWLAFHTGVPVVDRPEQAAFAVVSSPAALPELGVFAAGTDEAPHTSATVIVLDPDEAVGQTFSADGPGFEQAYDWAAPAFPADFEQRWAGNRAQFPRGVDLIIAGLDTVVGLPRTTTLTTQPRTEVA